MTAMTAHFDALSQAKHLSRAEIAALVRELLPNYIGCSEGLRHAFDTGGLFPVGSGEHFGELAVETALIALILANVSVHDPLARSFQVQSIVGACADLGVRYQDALDLTVREQRIKEILAAAH